MNPITTPLPGTVEDPRYPDQDGRFMGDTQFHSVAMTWLREALEDYFAGQNVYVVSNLIYYFREGDPTSRRDPDVLVAKGVGKHYRRSYRIWEEKVVPCTLFEVASKRTWRADTREKPQLYASLGVKEYFVFDPEGRYLEPVLQGFRAVRGRPVPMKPAADGSLVSRQLGLRLVPEEAMLRLVDLETGEPVLTRAEQAERERQRAEQERQRAEQERQRAEAMAAEVERLRAQLQQRTKR
jgi:Uma2 family endonuclease